MHATRLPLLNEYIPRPQAGPWEVLAETRSREICEMDLHILEGLGYFPPQDIKNHEGDTVARRHMSGQRYRKDRVRKGWQYGWTSARRKIRF